MRLHLLRHAEPEQFSNTSNDKTRELGHYGLQQCEQLKEQLDRDWSTTTLFCSTATRTLQTMRKSLNLSSFSQVHLLDELYLAPLPSLLSFLSQTKDSTDLFIIGHNNGLSDLVQYVTDHPIILQTGHYVCLDFQLDHWNEVSRGLASLQAEFVP